MSTDRTIDYTQWQPIVMEGSPYGDQQKDLAEHYWAEVGPHDPRIDAEIGPHDRLGRWSWTVLLFDGNDNHEAAGGLAAGEGEAKAAVDAWAACHLTDASGRPGCSCSCPCALCHAARSRFSPPL
jgi:hypothetical protein